MTEEVELKWISGFWRRIGALFIDTLILGATGLVLGLFLESFFVQIGAWGRLVGFSIALIYFGVMNSSITGGQTIGKKVLKLRVVDSKNVPISLGKSIIRYFILGIPFSLNGAQFSNEAMLSFLMYPLSLIIFGGLFSILYLYIFNRITRQSLHDLVVGTYVVNANVEQQELGKVWSVHLIIVAILFLAAAVVPAFTKQLAQSEPFKGMLEVQSALSNNPSVAYATISSGSSTFSSTNEETKTTTYVSSQVFLRADNVSDVELARRLASIVIANYPQALQKDTVQITLTYGYDIGIASSWSNHAHNFNPRELQSAE
ncbi:RDD family protein [Simiduia aestuariiviva]|uniref:Putative RDD family membrane protein YckC n=1 Tax=Simiduia aestuariiviva TaxID=1510459 RepID=A0A839UT97_9GAMM|nr:RDD family protein [Simiduia aestuariiviva]MBB3168597.1 putative RDD family membrane protein YckC [Simiduia aestuariiviva]